MMTRPHSKSMTRWGFFLTATVTLFLLNGCATYKSTALLPKAAAEVRGSLELSPQGVHTPDLWRVYLVRVDGRRPFFVNNRSTEPVLIDPGMHVLTVRAQSSRTTLWEHGQVELAADLKAGHAYQLQFAWRPGLMTYWVEDMATHEEVSLRKWLSPAVPVHHNWDFYFAPGNSFLQFQVGK